MCAVSWTCARLTRAGSSENLRGSPYSVWLCLDWCACAPRRDFGEWSGSSEASPCVGKFGSEDRRRLHYVSSWSEFAAVGMRARPPRDRVVPGIPPTCAPAGCAAKLYLLVTVMLTRREPGELICGGVGSSRPPLRRPRVARLGPLRPPRHRSLEDPTNAASRGRIPGAAAQPGNPVSASGRCRPRESRRRRCDHVSPPTSAAAEESTRHAHQSFG
jgi:hypothetical protein